MAKATHKSSRYSRLPSEKKRPKQDPSPLGPGPIGWRIARTRYPKEVAEKVDAILVKGGVSLDDVAALQLAETLRLLDCEEVTEADRYIASSLRHLRTICKDIAKRDGPATRSRKVAVPEGMRRDRPAKVAQHDLAK